MMGTQSADVERACKAHKIVHSKVRNRLVNTKVNMLLHCCMNLRLLKKDRIDSDKPLDLGNSMENFLNQTILDECNEPSESGSGEPVEETHEVE